MRHAEAPGSDFVHPLFAVDRRRLRQVETQWGMAEGYVYFIAAGHDPKWVKIGFTSGDPRARVRALQTGCPVKLWLMGAIVATAYAEAEIHDVLKEERGIGEWFELTPYVRSLIEMKVSGEAI